MLIEQHQYVRAEAAARQALRINPQYAMAWRHLGRSLQGLDNPVKAIEALQKSIEMDPDQGYTRFELGKLFLMSDRFNDAVICFRECIEALPDFAEALNDLGLALLKLGRFNEAVEAFETCVARRPEYLTAHSNLLFCYCFVEEVSPEKYLNAALRTGEIMLARAKPFAHSEARGADDRPLRIGFVSGDFREHPVAFFIERVIAQFDSSQVMTVAYANQPESFDDAVTTRLRQSFTQWRRIHSESDQEAARIIYEDGIDILVDLAGHTHLNRLAVFAWKPAPIQVSWLGYLASTGVPGMDYFLADPVTAPEYIQAGFSEQLWLLPDTINCFTPPPDDPMLTPEAPPCRRNGFLTFGTFQRHSKISDRTLGLWARVLEGVPDAKLRIPSAEDAKPDLFSRMARMGIPRHRVITASPIHGRIEYLASHREVDIILDTFPYQGITTTCEALWMGVPTLTMTGNSVLSRQGTTLLGQVGLQDWVATDEDDFTRIAIDKSANLDALYQLRLSLRQTMATSALVDADRFTRNLLTAFREMHQRRNTDSRP